MPKSSIESMVAAAHWDNAYGTKTPDQLSWSRSHLETSISFIERSTPNRSARIIDAGGGESTLVDDLLGRGSSNLTVLDISRIALDATKMRLGAQATGVEWLVGDVTAIDLPPHTYDVWHDRAVFHFLTSRADRAAYIERVRTSVKQGGHVVIATFGPEGPLKCSGLDVRRYGANSLLREFGGHFRLVDSGTEIHRTPFGTTQQFQYCLLTL